MESLSPTMPSFQRAVPSVAASCEKLGCFDDRYRALKTLTLNWRHHYLIKYGVSPKRLQDPQEEVARNAFQAMAEEFLTKSDEARSFWPQYDPYEFSDSPQLPKDEKMICAILKDIFISQNTGDINNGCRTLKGRNLVNMDFGTIEVKDNELSYSGIEDSGSDSESDGIEFPLSGQIEDPDHQENQPKPSKIFSIRFGDSVKLHTLASQMAKRCEAQAVPEISRDSCATPPIIDGRFEESNFGTDTLGQKRSAPDDTAQGRSVRNMQSSAGGPLRRHSFWGDSEESAISLTSQGSSAAPDDILHPLQEHHICASTGVINRKTPDQPENGETMRNREPTCSPPTGHEPIAVGVRGTTGLDTPPQSSDRRRAVDKLGKMTREIDDCVPPSFIPSLFWNRVEDLNSGLTPCAQRSTTESPSQENRRPKSDFGTHQNLQHEDRARTEKPSESYGRGGLPSPSPREGSVSMTTQRMTPGVAGSNSSRPKEVHYEIIISRNPVMETYLWTGGSLRGYSIKGLCDHVLAITGKRVRGEIRLELNSLLASGQASSKIIVHVNPEQENDFIKAKRKFHNEITRRPRLDGVVEFELLIEPDFGTSSAAIPSIPSASPSIEEEQVDGW